LPVVLYTGQRRWDKIEPMTDLVHLGELFDEVIPNSSRIS
jgi:hypothetical protein